MNIIWAIIHIFGDMKKIAIMILAIVAANSCMSQEAAKRFTMLACIGTDIGKGATAIFHTPEGPGVYAEFFRYGSGIGTANSFGFGISIPTSSKSVTLGAGLGMAAMDIEFIGKRYSESFNGHAVFYIKKLALKAGFIAIDGKAFGNAGIGISL